jgi:arylsulfatase A-like enzyme
VRRRRDRWIVACLAAALAFACGDDRDAAPRLVILYAPCTVNRDYLAPYDPRIPFTPNLAAFALESIRFANHYTESPSSGIAYASIFSGSQADRHLVFRHPARLPDHVYAITEAYRDADYETFYWNSHGMATPALNYAQGVEAGNRFKVRLEASHPSFRAILARLKSDPDYRAFVMTNHTVAHGPYRDKFALAFQRAFPDRAPNLRRAEMRAVKRLYKTMYRPLSWGFPEVVERMKLSESDLAQLSAVLEWYYASNVRELDRLFGTVVRAVDAIGLGDETLIAFTADHGELLYRESADFMWSHSMSVEPEVLRVPLLIRLPSKRNGGQTYTGVSRSIDVFPTLAALSGVAIPPETAIDGWDLSAALLGDSPPPEISAYSHTTVVVKSVVRQMSQSPRNWSRVRALFPSDDPEYIWTSLRRGALTFKLRRSDAGEWNVTAFRTRDDATELVDVFDPNDPVHAEAAADLRAYKKHLVDSYRRSVREEGGRLLPRDREERALRELGYIE